MVQHLSGPSHFWRCQSCRSILQKKGTMAMVSAGATIAGSVSCGSCGRSYSASAVYGGQYDLPEVELHCPHCNTHLRGPGEELLGQPCPSCNRVLPKRHPYKYDDPAEAYAKAQYWIGMVALKQCPDVVSSLLGSLGLTQLPPEIAHLKTLTMLSLWDNRLSSLPPGIALLPALRELDLKDNQFSSLPPEIGRLTALTKLDLSDNQLSFLPPEIGRLIFPTKNVRESVRFSSVAPRTLPG